MNITKSNAEKVKDFTDGTSDTVKYFDKKELLFLFQMCFSELVELLQTEFTKSEIENIVKESINKDFSEYEITDNMDVKISDQADAVIDCWYYALNAFCKKGINLSKVFDEVHNANMRKKFPDNTFHRREDGKIIKPPGWYPPSILDCVLEQKSNGAWHTE